jgi:hypothetical protein
MPTRFLLSVIGAAAEKFSGSPAFAGNPWVHAVFAHKRAAFV